MGRDGGPHARKDRASLIMFFETGIADVDAFGANSPGRRPTRPRQFDRGRRGRAADARARAGLGCGAGACAFPDPVAANINALTVAEISNPIIDTHAAMRDLTAAGMPEERAVWVVCPHAWRRELDFATRETSMPSGRYSRRCGRKFRGWGSRRYGPKSEPGSQPRPNSKPWPKAPGPPSRPRPPTRRQPDG